MPLAVAVAVVACLAAWLVVAPSNLRRSVHLWDTYHYYLGAKYFPELGHEGLYDCTLAADLEAGQGGDLDRRYIRDLSTNRAEPARRALPRAERCRQRFTPQRWALFAGDVALFRRHIPGAGWHNLQYDHGFNASPVWIAAARVLLPSAPGTALQLSLLASLDFLILGALWLVVIRCLGWRAAAAAGCYWACNFPGRPYWTGGAFVRQPWLLCSVGGLCLLHQGHALSAGAALGAAGALRAFPLVLLVGPSMNMVRHMALRRWEAPARQGARLLAGAALSAALLVGASLLTPAGPGAWSGWAHKIQLHAATPTTNTMGLRTVIAYSPRTRMVRMAAPGRPDPLGPWRAARQQTYQKRRPLLWLLTGLFIVLLARGVRGRPAWEAATLSIGLLPVAFSSSCYYHSLLLGYGLLAPHAPLVAGGLNLHAAVGWLAPWLLRYMDDQYAGLSALSVLYVTGVTAWAALRRGRSQGDPS